MKESSHINSVLDLVLTAYPEAIDVNVLEYIRDKKMVLCVFAAPAKKSEVLKKCCYCFYYGNVDFSRMSDLLSEFSCYFLQTLNSQSVNEN